MGRTSNAPQKREQIIRGLYDCLVKEGHHNITIKKIAKAANVTPGVIHYYFKNKDEIILGLVRTMTERYSRELKNKLTHTKTRAEKVDAALDFAADMTLDISEGRAFYNLIHLSFEKEELARELQIMFDRYQNLVSDIFKDIGGDTEVEPPLENALIALIEGLGLRILLNRTSFKKTDIRKLIQHTVRNGMLKESVRLKAQ